MLVSQKILSWLTTKNKRKRRIGSSFWRINKSGKLLQLPVWVSYVHGTQTPSMNFWCLTSTMMANLSRQVQALVWDFAVQELTTKTISLMVSCRIQLRAVKTSSNNALYWAWVWPMQVDPRLNFNNCLFPQLLILILHFNKVPLLLSH